MVKLNNPECQILLQIKQDIDTIEMLQRNEIVWLFQVLTLSKFHSGFRKQFTAYLKRSVHCSETQTEEAPSYIFIIPRL